MRFEIFFYLSYYIIFCNQFNFLKALIGCNVNKITSNEFLFIVSIQSHNQKENKTEHVCTGTLVSRTNILLAEHCLERKELPRTIIIVGTTKSKNVQEYSILSWITYDQWATKQKIKIVFEINDIAIIKIINAVDNKIIPAPISNVPNKNLYGLNVTIASLRVSSTDGYSITQESALVSILTNQQCEVQCSEILKQKVSLQDRKLCTAANPIVLLDSVDSGGPLLYDGVLIAVNTGICPHEESIFHPRKVNIHFSVDYYKNFIVTFLENNE